MQNEFIKIGVVNFSVETNSQTLLEQLLVLLLNLEKEVYLEELVHTNLEKQNKAHKLSGRVHIGELAELCEICDLLIVIGGDGSMLQTAREAVVTSIPLLGVNMGRLGFLNDVSPSHLNEQIVDIVINGNYQCNDHFLLQLEVFRNNKCLTKKLALNDVVVQSQSRMIDLRVLISQQFVYDLRADGIIIATPTGSTAYALSSGGSIIHPKLNAIEVVPINPQTLSNRPIIVDGEETLEVRILLIDGSTSINVVCDGLMNVALETGDQIFVKKFNKQVSFLQRSSSDFYQACRNKLNWNNNIFPSKF